MRRWIYTDVVRQAEENEQRLGLQFFDSFGSMLPEADILSFHCPLTPENTEILNRRTLALLKDGAVVINTARGKLINPDDLYASLMTGHISAAALDTHYEEPIEKGYRLAELENVILTPHIGGLSYEAFHGMMQGAVENIVAFKEGRLGDIENKRLI